MERAAIYARLGSHHGWRIAQYVDKGFSGAKELRPGRFLRECRKRLIDGVVVYRCD